MDARDFARYQRQAKRLFGRFRRFVYAFYDPVFFEVLLARPFRPDARGGDHHSRRRHREGLPLERFWTQLMLFGVGIDRFRRRIGLGPKPVAA